jgi:acetylxylan esterase
MLRLRTVTCLLSAGAALVAAPSVRAASWKTGVNYGGASGATRTDFYVPDNVKSKPAVLFSIHYCSGQGSNAHSWFQSYADQYGFIIIAPTAHGNCFDANLHRSGEQADFVLMIDYAIKTYNADTDRVYAAGLSSGACMTQALMADYPDRFTAGSSFAGVPAGAWTGGNDYAWSTSGVSGAQAWGDKVRNADPGFTGARPHVQIWHGQGDTTLTFSQTYPQELQQWPNVFGLDSTKDGVETMIKPSGAKNTWDRLSFKDCSGDLVVEVNKGGTNVTHDLGSEGIWGDAIRFFDLANGGVTKKACGSMGTGGMGGMGSGGGAGTGAGGKGSGGAATGGAGNGGTGGMTGGGAGTMSGVGGSASGAGGTGTGGAGGTGTAGTGTGGAGGMGTGGTGTGGTGGTGTGGTGTGGTGTGGTGTGGAGGTAMGTGGTAGTAGKATGTGGTTGAAGAGGPVVSDGNAPANDSSGCGCHVAGQSKGGLGALVLVGGLALLGTRRRRRERG